MTPTPRIVVRSVRWNDFDDVRESYFRLYDERVTNPSIGITLFAERPSMSDETNWFAATFRRVLAGDEIFQVAEVDDRVVGTCSIHRAGLGPTSEMSHVGELGILVRQEYRGKGVGSALLASALDEARSRFELVYLSVFSVNVGAQRLYRRFGFTPCGHFPRLVKRGNEYLDEDRMVLDFSKSPRGTGANR